MCVNQRSNIQEIEMWCTEIPFGYATFYFFKIYLRLGIIQRIAIDWKSRIKTTF